MFNKVVTYCSCSCALHNELWLSDCSPKAQIARDTLLGAGLLREYFFMGTLLIPSTGVATKH